MTAPGPGEIVAPEPDGEPDTLAVALAALDGLDGRPVAEHVDVFGAIHEALTGHLALGED